MSSITFSPGTVIPSTWLNDVNTVVYTTVPAIQVTLTGLAAKGVNNDITSLTALSSVPTVVTTAINAGDASTLSAAAAAANTLDRQYRQVGQIVTFQTGTFNSGVTGIPLDNTIPQSTEGKEYLTVTLTPKDAASTLSVEVVLSCGTNVSTTAVAALFRDSGANALAVTCCTMPLAADAAFQLVLQFSVTSGSTTATTFKVRAGSGGGTFCINGFPNGGALFGGVACSRITVTEYLP